MWIDAKHWSDIKKWDWKNFSPQEMACKHCGRLHIEINLMQKLQRLREILNKPLIINSGYRCEAYNTAIGGAKASYHMNGQAADISIEGHDPEVMEKEALKLKFTGFGFYPTFMHLDTGPRREWGERVKPKFEPVKGLPELKIVPGGAKGGGLFDGLTTSAPETKPKGA